MLAGPINRDSRGPHTPAFPRTPRGHRWFSLTRTRLSYFSEEGGEFLASCPLNTILFVGIDDATAFKVSAAKPFTKTGASAVTLACRDTVSSFDRVPSLCPSFRYASPLRTCL